MINRVPSVDAKFEIEPGNTQGGSIIKILEKKTKPYHLQIGVTDEGHIDNGEPYLTADFSLDNPFNINDVFIFRLNGSSVQKSYQGDQALELNYTFPIGSYLYELIYFKFSYDREVIGLNNRYKTTGDTNGGTFKINKIIFRNQTNKLKLSFAIQHKDTNNYFASSKIDISSYRTSIFQGYLTHTLMKNWGQLTSVYTLHKGVDWFDARNDSYYKDLSGLSNKERHQFLKHTLDLYLYYYFPDRTYQLTSNLHLQYSDDYLYDNDKLRVGSHYTVRGYENSLYGNKGGYIHNNIEKRFNLNYSTDYLQSISPLLGFDYGYVDSEIRQFGSTSDLIGGAVGFKTYSKIIQTEFTLSQSFRSVRNDSSSPVFRYSFLFAF